MVWLLAHLLVTATSFALLVTSLRAAAALRRPAPAGPRAATVTIVTPARDEVDGVTAAVESMLATGARVVAVDDRSVDGTGAALDALAGRAPGLRVVHVDALPEGWLGKVHALHRGAAEATGDWLLFMDADVRLAPDTLDRVVADAEAHGLDFVSLLPRIESAGFLGDTTFAFALATIGAGTRPWAMPDPDSRAYGATGAFMLARRAVFARSAGFEWLKLEVSDDFGLCLVMKNAGGRCALLDGSALLTLRWYRSLGEIGRRMQKNFFAITGRCQPARCVAHAAFGAWLAISPWIAPAWCGLPGAAALIGAAVVMSRRLGRPRLPALFVHVGALLTAGIILRAAWVGARIGGVEWRGTRYPSAAINAGRRVFL